MGNGKIVSVFTLGLIGLSTTCLRADDIAADNASNYTSPPGWVDGSNGGYGFTPWSLISQGDAFNSIATNTPVGANAWDLQSADDGSSGPGALRGFSGFNTNDSILLDMDIDDVPADGFAGADFYDSYGDFQFELFVAPASVESYNGEYGTTLNPNDYIIQDNNPLGGGNEFVDTGISDLNGDAVHMDLKLLDGVTHTYTVTVTQQGGASYTSPVGSTLFTDGDYGPSEIDGVEFADQSTGTPFLFNNFVVVPLPAAAISAVPLLGILAASRLKRR